jgi:hypothetical protein
MESKLDFMLLETEDELIFVLEDFTDDDETTELTTDFWTLSDKFDDTEDVSETLF